jgi:hypothetical protein
MPIREVLAQSLGPEPAVVDRVSRPTTHADDSLAGNSNVDTAPD